MKNLLEAIKRVKGSLSPEQEKEADRAPVLDTQGEENEGLMEKEGEVNDKVNEIMAMSDEEKARLLESLISSPMGREPVGLREKASEKMKADLSSLRKV